MKLKKIASFLLVLIIVLGMCPGALAAESTPAGGTSPGISSSTVTRVSTYGKYEGFYDDSDLYPGSKAFHVYVAVPAAYEGVFQSDPNAKTDEFIKLAVTYVLPADEDGNVAPGKFPALIQCMRYDLSPSSSTGRYNNDPTSQFFLKHGYAIIKIDLRGMGASFGIAKGFGTEENGLDVKYIIENWLEKQEWYSGKCAMYGSSNQGVIGNTTAVHNPNSLAGYQVGVASVDYYSQKYPNGVSIANNNMNLDPWSYDTFPYVKPPRLIFGPIKSYDEWIKNPTAQFVDDDPEGKEAYEAYVQQQTYNEMFFSYMTVPNVYRDSVNKDGWKIYEDIVLVEEIDRLIDSGIETYNYAGYADIAATAQLALATVTDGHIVISNGNHGGAMTGGSFPNFNSNEDLLRYFDWLLKGVDNGFDQTPFAYYYLLDTNGNPDGTLPAGKNPAHYTDNLPYKSTEYRDYYLDTKKISQTSPYWLNGEQSNNGTLSLNKPGVVKSIDYRVDTSINFDITGMSNGPIGRADLKDSVDSRSITFTTAPFTEKVNYIGIATMDIWASCENSNDFDLIALLEVVRPDGTSNYLSRGAIRASHRYPSRPSVLWDSIPGLAGYMHSSLKADVEAALAEGLSKPTLLKFNFELSAVTLNEGDCLRVTLFCVTKRLNSPTQSYMYYDKDGNLLTGEDLPLITFYTGGDYASRLTLPVYKSVKNTLNGTVSMDDGSYTGPATMYLLEDNYFLQYNGKWMKLSKSSNKIRYRVDESGRAYFYNAGFTFQPEGEIIADGLAQLYKGEDADRPYRFPKTFDGYDGLVRLRQGSYIGVEQDGIYVWKGIQYAIAPLFQAPQKMPDAAPDAEPIEAIKHGPSTSGAGSADPNCLTLSVYVNPDWDVEKDGPRSVFMWVFGSANMGGAVGNPDWTNFVKANPNIIVVTPTHRGGRYGSLDLSQLIGYNDPKYLDENGENIYRFSNNLARLDILEVLKWINENIEAFGGNKNDVAIGGQSSGGNLCASVMMMPESKDLWHKALLQESFPLDGSLMPLEEAKRVAKFVFNSIDMDPSTDKVEPLTTMDELLTLKPDILAATQFSSPSNFGYKALSPVIDEVVIRSNYFEQLLGPNGLWAGKPILFGNNEGCYDQMYLITDSDEANINRARSRSAGNLGKNGWYGYPVGNPGDPDYIPNYADYIVEQYIANYPERDAFTAAKDLDYDMNMRIPSILFAEAASTSTNVYFYQLRFNSSAVISHIRAGHGSENSVIARSWVPNARGEDSAEERAIVANRISDIWAKFILTGDPNNADLGGAVWRPYKSGTRDTMILDNEFYMVNGVRNKDTDLLLPLTREYSHIMYISGVPSSTRPGLLDLSKAAVMPAGLPARATSGITWDVIDNGNTTGTMVIRAKIKDGMVSVAGGKKTLAEGVFTNDYVKYFHISIVPYSDDTPSTPPSTTSSATAYTEINGQRSDIGQITTRTTGGKTVRTIQIDNAKLNNALGEAGEDATITLALESSDLVEISVQSLLDMADKGATLEINTGNVIFTLPASLIDFRAIYANLSSQADLNNVRVTITISEPSESAVRIVEETADSNGYQIIVPPVEFTITYEAEDRTCELTRFTGYVERLIALPEGVDPNLVTTAVVLGADGSFHHVPTEIVTIDGRHYAKVRTLTNSIYTVIRSILTFPDTSTHWARNEVNELGSRLISKGDENGNFNPDKNITRAEFAAIIVRALGLKPEDGKVRFNDVQPGSWYFGYVNTACEYGIINGFEDGTFRPNEYITREQAMVMTARAMELTGIRPALSIVRIDLILSAFADGGEVSEYAEESVASCVLAGIVYGREGNLIAPADSITRAEVAVLIIRLLTKSNLI